jgi:hypothetical protein
LALTPEDRKKLDRHSWQPVMAAGVTEDPDTVYIDEEVTIGHIGPNITQRKTVIGERCRIDGSV